MFWTLINVLRSIKTVHIELNWWNYSYWIERKWLTLWNKKSIIPLLIQSTSISSMFINTSMSFIKFFFFFEKTFPINIKIQIHFIYAFWFFNGILLRTKAGFLCLWAMDVGSWVGWLTMKIDLGPIFLHLINERSSREMFQQIFCKIVRPAD